MYCPKCNNYCNDNERFCSECGYAFVKPETPVKSEQDAEINFGRGNALKDVQINKSHTDNSVHNINYDQRVIYERQKSQEEIAAENEGEFMQAILSCLSDGILDQAKYANLKILARQKGISDARAQQLIDEMRNNVAMKSNGGNNSFIADRTVREVRAALSSGNCEILKSKYQAIKQLANNINDNDIQFYSNMLYASLSPESCTLELMKSRVDNYWQQFWCCIAYFKCGIPESAVAIMSRLGDYGFPNGNIALLMAINSLVEYRKNPTQKFYAQQVAGNLDSANEMEISEQLIPLWLATQQAASDCPQVEDSFRFYFEVTLKELCTMVTPKMPDVTKADVAAPELPADAMKAPEMPKMDPQNVQLSQMQGFNPLKAAEQLMSQPMGSMPQMPGMPPMGTMPMPGIPPMGTTQMPGVPPMGMSVPPMGAQMPGVPPMGVPPIGVEVTTPPPLTSEEQ
ncbi:MAG: zinc ribbon domain-containing protein [Alistipes sp.]|nr:zinc ribbon domain-containing protein [Alistipes sp.]